MGRKSIEHHKTHLVDNHLVDNHLIGKDGIITQPLRFETRRLVRTITILILITIPFTLVSDVDFGTPILAVAALQSRRAAS